MSHCKPNLQLLRVLSKEYEKDTEIRVAHRNGQFFKLETKKIILTVMTIIRKISKAIPLQALTDPDSSRRLRLSDFKTVGT
jgi:hypothetical protein